MLFEKFAEQTLAWWSEYLQRVSDGLKWGHLRAPPRSIVLFPNILLVTKTREMYVAELIGATEVFRGLTQKTHKERSIYSLLSQFDEDHSAPAIPVDATGCAIRNACLARKSDYDAAKTRFPFVELYPTRLHATFGKGCLFDFTQKVRSYEIGNCVLVNRYGDLYRCKNILNMLLVAANVTTKELKHILRNYSQSDTVHGVGVATTENSKHLIVSAQFQNLFLTRRLNETTIGEFLRTHPEIIKRAFKTDRFLYEPTLDWIEHDGSVNETAINPDLIVKREDGFYDIYDLKTALLHKQHITRGPRKRRRFIDYVNEGIAQLANYRWYFEFEKNRRFAEAKYGIRVNQPKLVLVVGSWENVNADEISEATRSHHNCSVIDFDTLVQLFLGPAAALTESEVGTGT